MLCVRITDLCIEVPFVFWNHYLCFSRDYYWIIMLSMIMLLLDYLHSKFGIKIACNCMNSSTCITLHFQVAHHCIAFPITCIAFYFHVTCNCIAFPITCIALYFQVTCNCNAFPTTSIVVSKCKTFLGSLCKCKFAFTTAFLKNSLHFQIGFENVHYASSIQTHKSRIQTKFSCHPTFQCIVFGPNNIINKLPLKIQKMHCKLVNWPFTF